MTARVWTPERVRALGVRVDGVTACEIVYGCGRTKAYELLGKDEVDFPTIRRGRQYIVPVAAILRLLDIPEKSEAGSATDPAAASVSKDTTNDDHSNSTPHAA